MVFSSHFFLFYFLPVTLTLYYITPYRWKHFVLTLASYIFYGWANPYFIILMLLSTTIDYGCGIAIWNRKYQQTEIPGGTARTIPDDHQRRVKPYLYVSIVSNLSLLGFFKYFNFGIESFNIAVSALGMDFAVWQPFFQVTLPLGISFYTFQSMSYTIDVYRGSVQPIRRFIDFSAYVSMFPQLVAGPIIRFKEIERQLLSRVHTLQKFSSGISLFILGLSKKIIIANSCGKVADVTFNAQSIHFFEAWYGAISYAFQIYFDFSGYSDMAIGLGLMLGFTFPLNFNRPYVSQSITEFWQRWHMSLSRWFKDYLYIPLGGNRKGVKRTYVNLLIVMMLVGIWHGAAWTFVLWGAFHSAFLILERILGRRPVYHRLNAHLKTALTFLILCISWVFFRAASVEQAFTYIGHMFAVIAPNENADLLSGIVYQPYYVMNFIIAGFLTWGCKDAFAYARQITWAKATVIMALFVVSVIVLTTQTYNPFIYFIF